MTQLHGEAQGTFSESARVTQNHMVKSEVRMTAIITCVWITQFTSLITERVEDKASVFITTAALLALVNDECH